MIIQDADVSASFQRWLVSGTPIPNTGSNFVQYPVTLSSSGGSTNFSNNHRLILGTIVPGPQGATGATGPTGATGATGATGPYYTSIYASAYSTADQTITPGTASNIAYDMAGISSGIIVTTGASGYFTILETGIYKFIYYAQVLGSGNGGISIWLKIDGANVPDTTTFTLFKNGEETIISTEYLLSLTANQQVQVWATSIGSACTINYIEPGGTAPNDYPAAPGIITNIYRIAS